MNDAAAVNDRGRIVVGVDSSDGARRALRWGLDEGRLRHAPVEALAVWSYLDQQAITAQGFLPEFDEAAAAASLHELVAEAAAGFDDVEIIERVVCDLAARALIAASTDADLLVVGARGLGLVKGMLLGSVSDHCVRHSACTVAVVRGSDEPRRNEIVVGIDRSEHAQAALRWAIDEADRRGAVVRAVAAWQYPVATAMGSEFAVLTADDLMAGADAVVDRALEAAARDRVAPLPEVVRTVAPGHAGETLLDAAAGAAMLVVGARGHGGFAGLLLGSTSNYCVHHAQGPVVVVR